MKSKLLIFLAVFLSFSFFINQAKATEEFLITIKNHKFTPEVIVVPSNQKVKLKVQNLDDVAEEFESDDLDREKIVAANSSVVIFIGPLPAGEYHFVGEFNPETAHGMIKAE